MPSMRAQKSKRVFVIELRIRPNEVSSQLARIANEVRKVRGSSGSSRQSLDNDGSIPNSGRER